LWNLVNRQRYHSRITTTANVIIETYQETRMLN
jgi:hypothetical protein